ncbi:nucleoside monophosphate kinase [Candidatus Parcubacteria bacterium]|nr:nucleoside monophosphate kinase [Candidatus Parcubacteria bacterium]
MTNEPRFWAVGLIGPVASGKGTQAELLSEELGLVHLENSKIIEEKFKNDPEDPEVVDAKKAYLAGQWINPKVVVKWIVGTMKEIADRKDGIVLSSAFRTEEEAGEELEFFEKNYGKENIKIISLSLSEEVAMDRSLNRRICKANRHPIPNFPEFKNITTCPKDGSELETRILDKPDTIKARYKEHFTRTMPVIDFMTKKGYNIIEVNGEQSIEDVHRDILNKLW